MTERTIVIVGGGLAGATAATTLRERGYDGRIVLRGCGIAPSVHPPAAVEGVPERGRPRRRVRASRAVVRGQRRRAAARDDGQRRSTPAPTRSSSRREAASRTSSLLLATGASPRRLTGPGSDLDGVHTLRTLDDSDALRAELSGGRQARRDRRVRAGSGSRSRRRRACTATRSRSSATAPSRSQRALGRRARVGLRAAPSRARRRVPA